MTQKAEKVNRQTFKIRKNDLVQVIAGKEKGKSGRVIKVLYDRNRVLIEKLNMVKRHTKPDQKQQQGGIIEKEGGIHMSNVMLLCGKCNKPTRIGYLYLEDGQKARICKKCKEIIS
jgi:large subunit ribosomal protein L24